MESEVWIPSNDKESKLARMLVNVRREKANIQIVLDFHAGALNGGSIKTGI